MVDSYKDLTIPNKMIKLVRLQFPPKENKVSTVHKLSDGSSILSYETALPSEGLDFQAIGFLNPASLIPSDMVAIPGGDPNAPAPPAASAFLGQPGTAMAQHQGSQPETPTPSYMTAIKGDPNAPPPAEASMFLGQPVSPIVPKDFLPPTDVTASYMIAIPGGDPNAPPPVAAFAVTGQVDVNTMVPPCHSMGA